MPVRSFSHHFVLSFHSTEATRRVFYLMCFKERQKQQQTAGSLPPSPSIRLSVCGVALNLTNISSAGANYWQPLPTAHFTHGGERGENILRGIIKWMDDTIVIRDGDDWADMRFRRRQSSGLDADFSSAAKFLCLFECTERSLLSGAH